MSRKLLFLAALLAAATIASAQQTIPLTNRPPDCYFQFGPLTTTVNGFSYDNRDSGCSDWVITYNSQGFSALSIALQSAPAAAGNLPGSWVTFAGSITTGINPNTATTKAETRWTAGYNPWVRVALTAVTGSGSIYGEVHGWRGAPSNNASIVGTVTVEGNKANNAVVPGSNNLGTLGCVATASAPNYTESFQVNCSTDLKGNTRVTVMGNAGGNSGQQTVTASAVSLASNAAKGACVVANTGNTAPVFLGFSGVTAATGLRLAPGSAQCIPVTNTNLLFVIASAAVGDGVSWISTN